MNGLRLLGSAGLAMVCASASALPVSAPKNFGTTDDAITVIGHHEFFPEDSGGGWGTVFDGRRSDDPLFAPISLPNGAVATQIVLYGVDSNAGEDLTLSSCATAVDESTGVPFGPLSCLLLGSTSGSPGSTIITADVTGSVIRYQQDIDSNGSYEVLHHFLRVDTPSSTAVRMVRLRWHRQVSPAPTSATFGDVPTGHPFFQFVEAMVAAGVTAGCGGGNYCPDAPLTRGQMAVFLAKALGLHWPWDTP
jgi:hypothetical protein